MSCKQNQARLSMEVQLAWEVMTCRALRNTYDTDGHACRWFNQHYGPFPSFDWLQSFPDEPLKEGETRSLQAVCNGIRYQLPELMSGCRKAPIMTIGINPNLTAFWPGTEGATWAYPYFDDIGQFAHYFRYRSIYQERFPLDFIRSHVAPGSEIKAIGSGRISRASRSKRDEQLTLELIYADSPSQSLTLNREYEVFFDKDQPFEAGAVIAAEVALPQGEAAELIQEEVGYYKRFREIFKRFKEMAGATLQHPDLRLGEDVCQADMVACASPGWDSWFTDAVQKGIVDECVHNRGWLAQQLLQTQPVVVVFAGLSSYDMFHQRFKMQILPELDPNGDTFEILDACVKGNYRLKTETPNGIIDARILISPHFSYAENFEAQCRFAQDQWRAFQAAYPKQVEQLKSVTTQSFDKSRMQVFIDRKTAPTQEQIGEAAWRLLMEHRYDAVELLSQGIHQEYTAHRLVYDAERGHLARSAGTCQFCDNALYRFPEGCPYEIKGVPPSLVTFRADALNLVRKSKE